MSTMTLEQLKQENAPEDEVTDDLTPEVSAAELEVAAEETTEELEEAGEPIEGETEEKPVEAWMQTEGETSDDKQHKGPSFRGLKQKYRAKIDNKDDEIAKLLAENEALKNGAVQSQPTQTAQPMPRPKREDFNFDEADYDDAVDAWNDAKLDAKLNGHVQQQTQTQQQDSYKQSIDNAVNQHYESAEKLVSEGRVTEDDYRNADQMVRGAIEQVIPGKGDAVSDFLISQLNSSGEGSAKVWYHIGKNGAALAKLKELAAKNDNGFASAMYLGELRAKLTSDPVKRVSQAPKPGSKLKGDSKPAADGALLKKYKAAGNDVQARIDLKREAKRSGVDTRNWS